MKKCALCGTKLINVGEGGLWACPRHPNFEQRMKKSTFLSADR